MFIYLKLLKEAPIKNSDANLKKVEEPTEKEEEFQTAARPWTI